MWRGITLAARYGYDTYGGNCHIIPNHGLIILSLLYGDDDLRRSLMIANTSGWDTDCNSGNVGCLLGIKNGLAGIEFIADLRQPLNDRLVPANRRRRTRDNGCRSGNGCGRQRGQGVTKPASY